MATTPTKLPKWFYKVNSPRSQEQVIRELSQLEKLVGDPEARGAFHALLWSLRVRNARAVSRDVRHKKGGK